MKLEFVKVTVPGYNNPQRTLVYEVFKYYFEDLQYTRKMFTEKLGVNHRVFTIGLRAYYTPEKIEELRAKKIVRSNIGVRVKQWADKLGDIEVFLPGFSTLFQDSIKEHPEKVMLALVELNDKFYRAKEAMKPIKKYANQAIKRKGGSSICLVANGLEARFKFILDELGIEYESQFNIRKYSYDFKVGNNLIEVDGRYHEKTRLRDKIKNKVAKDEGYNIIRFTEDQVKKQPLKIKRCLKNLVLNP